MVRWLLFGLFAVTLVGCSPATAKRDPDPLDEPLDMDTVAVQEKQPSNFAGDRVKQAVDPIPFDGNQALKYLEAICAIGPRMSGTRGMREQQELIKKHFEKLKLPVEVQEFQGKQVSRQEAVPMTNLIVRFQPELKRRVILCSHYDTRPIADQEPDPRKWREPFVSANDGGSGVAFLMEFANNFSKLKSNVGVDLVFFDGEEYIFEKRDRYFLGSEYFAQTWRKKPAGVQYVGAVLLDMIGGKMARFPAEINSLKRARNLVLEIWGIAGELNCNAFHQRHGHEVQDDHLSLLNVGIPAIDIIDFDYAHWHKLSDVPANCSAEPMEQVAKVLSVWIQRQK